MSHEHTVSFKVFLQKAVADEKPEVRRFGIDRDVVSSFTYLKQKLQAVFPALQGNDFAVSWKDAEGDDIIISSDDELIIALTEMQTDVRKLYIVVTDASPKHDQNSASAGRKVHIGVTCDGCNKSVEGFRYKCVQCHDYDLCASCEAKGMHSEHYMIRLPVPVNWRPHFGRRLAHHLSKSASRKPSCSPPEAPEAGQCPYGSGRNWGRHHHSHGGRHGGWLDALATYLNEWANLPGEGQGQGEGETTEKTSNKKQEDSHVEYLRNVGQTVANMLDPLGIDVDVEIQTHGGENVKFSKQDGEQKGSSDTPKAAEKPKTQNVTFADKNETVSKEAGGNKENNQTEQPRVEVDVAKQNEGVREVVAHPSTSSEQRKSPETEGWTFVLNEGGAQQTQEQDVTMVGENFPAGAAAPQAPAGATGPTEVPFPNLESIATAARKAALTAANNAMASQGYSGAMPAQSYAMYYPPTPGTTTTTMAGQFLPWNMPPPPQVLPQMNRVYPTLPTSVPTAPVSQPMQPLRPHIADAVQKMLLMGFSNEGGWLTQLLELKNGDIEKALDVLQPVRK